jgi:hypothetical protein
MLIALQIENGKKMKLVIRLNTKISLLFKLSSRPTIFSAFIIQYLLR